MTESSDEARLIAMSATGIIVVLGLVFILPLSLQGARQHWNATNMFLDGPPPAGWLWGDRLWVGFQRSAVVIVVSFAVVAIAISVFGLTPNSLVGRAAFLIALAAILIGCLSAVSTAVLGMPRQLIPPHLRRG